MLHQQGSTEPSTGAATNKLRLGGACTYLGWSDMGSTCGKGLLWSAALGMHAHMQVSAHALSEPLKTTTVVSGAAQSAATLS